MSRRTFLAPLAAAAGAALILGWGEADAGPRARARRRRVRRRIRRRHRRRVVRRVLSGRPVWVVPVALAVGWELLHEDRAVLVKETKFVERDGARVEVVIVQDGRGAVEEIEILREDTDDNRVELEGGRLPDGDTTTPGMDAEIEEEVEGGD